MANALSAVKDQFTATTFRDALNTTLITHSLAGLGSQPIRRHRRQLRLAPSLPALCVELGEVTARDVGAGGLRAMAGLATFHLALGRADETALFDLVEPYIDALREAVETHLSDGFQRLTFAGTNAEGEVYADTGIGLRLVPVRFAWLWLYHAGEY